MEAPLARRASATPKPTPDDPPMMRQRVPWSFEALFNGVESPIVSWGKNWVVELKGFKTISMNLFCYEMDIM
jgi:hypothetical protein